LTQLALYENPILVLGLVFDIIMILFVIIAVLLVFSLLTNSVEMKQFENGIRRLVGLSKHGYVTMILVQAFMFVLPSIVLAYFSSYLVLLVGYKYLLNFDMQY
jgi:ABC-type antimicrobial peptide transport system permease subunit